MVPARIPLGDEVVRAVEGALPRPGEEGRVALVPQAADLLEVGDLEGLQPHRRGPAVEAMGADELDERLLRIQALVVEVRRVLDLGDDPDGSAVLLLEGAPEGEDLLERRYLLAAVVEGVVRTHLRQPLLGAQGLEFGEREVLGEPARDVDAVELLRRAPRGELRVVRDVRRARDLGFVTVDEHAVLRHDEVGLDVVRPHRHGQLVGTDGVLGAVPGGAPMRDDEWGGHPGPRPVPLTSWVSSTTVGAFGAVERGRRRRPCVRSAAAVRGGGVGGNGEHARGEGDGQGHGRGDSGDTDSGHDRDLTPFPGQAGSQAPDE